MRWPTSRFIVNVEGLQLHYRTIGSGHPTCLFIHGFGEGGYVWQEFASQIARSCRAIVVDLRGHGESSWSSSRAYTNESYTADLLLLLQKLHLTNCILIGHSLGGSLAVRLASLIAQSVTAVICVDFGLYLDRSVSAFVRERFNSQFHEYDSVEAYTEFLTATRPLLAAQARTSVATSALRRTPNGRFRLKCDPKLGNAEHLDSDAELARRLRGLRCPVLFVRGEGSALFSRQAAEKTVSLVQNGRLREVPNAGHGVMLDNPGGFHDVAHEFIMDVAARSRD